MDTPQSRNEAILQNILGEDNTLGEPQSRIETLLMELLSDLSNSGINKTFSLVETITIGEGESVNLIERTGYNFTKVFIRGRIAAGEGGNIQTIIGGYNCGWWAENVNGGVADTFAQIINGMFFSEYGSQMTSLSQTGNNTTLVRREVSYGQLMTGNITSVQITSSKTFPEGTVFEIYGV